MAPQTYITVVSVSFFLVFLSLSGRKHSAAQYNKISLSYDSTMNEVKYLFGQMEYNALRQ
jgi:hypothetical protein